MRSRLTKYCVKAFILSLLLLSSCNGTPQTFDNNSDVKAFAHVSDLGVLLDSNNIYKVTHIATGNYLIEFATSLSSDKYTVVATINDLPLGTILNVYAIFPSINSIEIRTTANSTGDPYDAAFSMIVTDGE